jgi:two-component system, NarL family, invasion response regulator UvrY
MKILIADDHAIVRRGLKEILLDEFPSALIEDVGNADHLIEKVCKADWDVVITDLSMPGRSGLQAVSQVKVLRPKLPLLVLSVYPEEQYAIRALKAGAAGYLNKDMAPEELVNAIRWVVSGRKYITPIIAERLACKAFDSFDRAEHETLSDREFEVLKMLATGKSVSEIGAVLHLSITTISTYRSRILAKMNMKSNSHLTQYAIEHGLL